MTAPGPRRALIELMVMRLMTSQGREANPALLRIFSELLEGKQDALLVAAFERYERLGKSWVTPAAFLEEFYEEQILDDWRWLVYHLKIHGPGWKDTPDRWVTRRTAAVLLPDYDRENEKIPGKKAPDIPHSVRMTLLRLGAGNLYDGLRFLFEYPAVSWTDQTEPQYPGQRIKLTADIEAAWRRAWLRANG